MALTDHFLSEHILGEKINPSKPIKDASTAAVILQLLDITLSVGTHIVVYFRCSTKLHGNAFVQYAEVQHNSRAFERLLKPVYLHFIDGCLEMDVSPVQTQTTRSSVSPHRQATMHYYSLRYNILYSSYIRPVIVAHFVC